MKKFLVFLAIFVTLLGFTKLNADEEKRFHYIIQHHTVAGSMSHFLSTYNFIIDQRGFIFIGRDTDLLGKHVIFEKYPYNKEWGNWCSIGITVVGNYTEEKLNNYQISSLAFITKEVCREYGIPISRETILGHRTVSFTLCPGYDMEILYKELGI